MKSMAFVAPSFLFFLTRVIHVAIEVPYSPAEMGILQKQIHALVHKQMPASRFMGAIGANLKFDEKAKASLPALLTRDVEQFWQDVETVKQNALDAEKDSGVINTEERRV